jgi:hypothetical protein
MNKIFLITIITFFAFILSDYSSADTIYHSFPKDLRYKKESILTDNCIVVKYEEDKEKSPWRKPFIKYYSWDSKRNFLLIDTVMAKKNEKFRVDYSDPQERKKLISSIKESGTHFIITKSNTDSIDIFCVRIDYRHPKYMRYFDPAGDTSFYFQVKGTSDAKEIPISDLGIIEFHEDEAKVKLKDGRELLGKFIGKVIGGKEFYEIYIEGLDKAGNLVDAGNRTRINLKEVYKIEFVRFDAQNLQITDTYHRFGLSFKIPEGQKITEKGVPLFGEKPTKEYGSIWIKSDLKTEPLILVSWVPSKKRDYEIIAKMMGASIKAMKPKHDIHLEKKMRELKKINHRLLLQRVCTQGKEGILLHVVTGWFCDQSSKIYQIHVSAPWKKPTFVVHSLSNPVPDWPSVKNDPSFIAFQQLIKSFICHDL